MTRRGLLIALLALPFLRHLKPKPLPMSLLDYARQLEARGTPILPVVEALSARNAVLQDKAWSGPQRATWLPVVLDRDAVIIEGEAL